MEGTRGWRRPSNAASQRRAAPYGKVTRAHVFPGKTKHSACALNAAQGAWVARPLRPATGEVRITFPYGAARRCDAAFDFFSDRHGVGGGAKVETGGQRAKDAPRVPARRPS